MGKDLKCSYCDRRFSVYRSLRRHENVHTGNLHHCDQCNKGFTDPWILRRHLLIHGRKMPVKEDPKEFPCKQCGIVFLIKRNLESHLCSAGRRAPPKVKYQCSECRVTYTKPSAIRDHKCSKSSSTIIHQVSQPEMEKPQESSENVPGGYLPPACPLGDAWPIYPPDDMFRHQVTSDDQREETFSSSSEYVYRCSTSESNLWTPSEVPEVFPNEARLVDDKSSPEWVPGFIVSPEGSWKTQIGCGISVSQNRYQTVECVETQTVEYDENQTIEYIEYNETSEDRFVPECANGPINGYWSREGCSTDYEKSPWNVSLMSHMNNLKFSQTSLSKETVKSPAFADASIMLPSFSRENTSVLGGTLNSSKCPPSVCYPGVIVSRKSWNKTDLTVEHPPVDVNELESDVNLHKWKQWDKATSESEDSNFN